MVKRFVHLRLSYMIIYEVTILILKGQSHGDFPIFSVTSLINLYFQKKKQAEISF